MDFFNVLTGPTLLELTEDLLPEHRDGLYPPTVALSMFIKQSLDADGSCQRVVNGLAAQRAVEGLPIQGVGTGGYCRARQRLPAEMVTALTREQYKAFPGELTVREVKAKQRVLVTTVLDRTKTGKKDLSDLYV